MRTTELFQKLTFCQQRMSGRTIIMINNNNNNNNYTVFQFDLNTRQLCLCR